MLLSLFVRLFPRRFRDEFGADIAAQVRRDCAEARTRGRAAHAWCWTASLADVACAALAERLAPTWHAPAVAPSAKGPDMFDHLEHWRRDLTQATRALRRTPGFTLVTVLTLALAIGATTAMFTVVNAVLINPLPYGHADRLMTVQGTAPGSQLPPEFGVADEFYVQYREQSKLLEDFAFYNSFTSTLRVGDRVERVRMSMPTYTLFATLGVTPLFGRMPAADDSEKVALISYALWQTWFGGDPNVLGRTIQASGDGRVVIGVMRPDFRFPSDSTLLWMPVTINPAGVRPGQFGNGSIGRLKPGATSAQLAAELTTLAKGLPARFGGSANYAQIIQQFQAIVRPMTEDLLGPSARPLGVLFGAAVIVLIIACANVANLFTVRAEGRRREMAVRQAIGARRTQLLRAQLSEVLVVAACAGVLAVLLARLILPIFIRLAPADVPRLSDAGLSPLTMLFTAIVALVAALACGLVPAFRASAPRVLQARDGSRGTTSRRRWGRDALVAAQTALALVLLIGSGLLFRSYSRLSHVNPGYSTKDIFTFQIAAEQPSLNDGPSYARLSMDFMDRLRALPGVESVGLVENVPLDEGTSSTRFRREGQTGDAGTRINYTYAGEDYYKTMSIKVLSGRAFVRDDSISSIGNVVISKSAANLLWPGADPLGRKLQRDGLQTWETVIGVVDDVIQENYRRPAQALVYFPQVGHTPKQWGLSSPAYVVKSARAETIAPDIRAVVRQIAPEAPMYRAYTMAFLADRQMRDLSFTMLTLGLVSALALALGALGLYGALSYVVAERTREIGVRMALGAEPRAVRRMVVVQGAQVVIAGIAVGLAVAFMATGALGRLLYDVESRDLLTFAAMSLSMLLVGFFASYVPARRASNVDPIVSLRSE